MKINLGALKKVFITFGVIIVSVYTIFLLAPFIVSPIANKYVPKINEELEKATGFTTKIEGFKLVTTPKFTVGVKVNNFELYAPNKKEIAHSQDFSVKMSLIPLLVKKVEINSIQLKDLNLYLGLNKDGSFEIEKYIPNSEEETDANTSGNSSELPFGLKLSNKLPDLKIDGYKLTLSDLNSGKNYEIKGNKAEITDFVINKGIKIHTDGNITLAGREQFKYNLKINNKIMPDVQLNDLVFNPQDNNKKEETPDFDINILDILKGVYNNNITADIAGDMTFTKDGNSGYLTVNNMAVSPNGIKLPPSDLNLKLKGNKTEIDSNLYTAENEVSKVTGFVKTGKHTNLDINCKSNAELANLVRIINAIALTFNVKDLQTLSANGKLDADFNIKSDLKKVNSNGYFKIPSANVNYGLYNISIDKINADIALNNNNINIKNIGFTILGQPLKLYGTITEDAKSNLHLIAENLNLKGLVIACGQASLLKENPIYSGLVTLKADIVGKLDSIRPTAKIILTNVDLKNIPSDLRIKLPNTSIDIISDGKTFSGQALSTNIKMINPALTVSIPRINANIKEDVIEIPSTPVQADKIRFNLSGKIKNYLSEKVGINFVTSGDIKSTLTGDMNINKQTLNLNFATTDLSSIIIPSFDKSRLDFNGNIAITGNMANPILNGVLTVPIINIPEIPVQIESLVAKLNGPIAKGYATVEKFSSGGIKAENITTDFLLKGNDFYLNNMKGSAFDGKFNGNIIYNLATAKTNLDFSGSVMNAEKAIYGAAGIKNALTGTLGFNTKMDLTVYPDYNAMMKSIVGKLDFKIEKGAFGKIGRLENFICAQNIMSNLIFKTTVETISNLVGIKNTAEFSFLTGSMNLSNGWANIDYIKSSGVSLAYYITGKYNLINGTANVVILGRLNGTVVKLLGPLGDMSASKLLSYIPKFGDKTAAIVEQMTTNPEGENIDKIPGLTEKDSTQKEFKVIYNGGIESATSVKSFKWLSKPDLSALEQKSLTDTIKSIQPSVKTDVNNTVSGVKNIINSVKNTKQTVTEDAEIQNSVNELKNSVSTLKNLFKTSGETVNEE